jgi:DNA-dependent RNA polymerase auxiliary subunit epsilon
MKDENSIRIETTRIVYIKAESEVDTIALIEELYFRERWIRLIKEYPESKF